MHYVNDINLVPRMGQIIKVQRPVSLAPINGLYHRPVCDIRGRIYNSFAGGIIVQTGMETNILDNFDLPIDKSGNFGAK